MESNNLEISFPGFHKIDKFYWSPDRVFLLSILALLLLVSLFEGPLPDWIGYLLFSGLLVFVYQLIRSNYTYEILKGAIRGEIKFGTKSIEFDNHRYAIDGIESLSFSFRAKEGEVTLPASKSINGRLSRGVDNSVTIKFKDGKTVTIYFQVTRDFDLESLKLMLVFYAHSNLISFNTLISLLKLNYKEVQELKSKYF